MDLDGTWYGGEICLSGEPHALKRISYTVETCWYDEAVETCWYDEAQTDFVSSIE